MEFEIREVGPDEAELLASIIRDAFQDVARRFDLTPENCPTHPSNCTPEWIHMALGKGARYFLLRTGEGPCGCAALRKADEEKGYLERLSVLPAYRRRGLGRALVQRVTAEAKVLGLKRLEIGIIAGQLELKAWYEDLGFQLKETARFKHLPFEVALMGKNLRDGQPQ
ncbi:MAG: GNAT family N-acetyltransferase [Thermodesulfobacteriota bacterium]